MTDQLAAEHPKQSILTVERAAWIAMGLLAACLRFFQLGLRPLSEGEAVQALAVYRFTQGATHTAPAGTVPALFTGNVAAFSLLGASDITARWLPALAGLILVLLPYWLRHRLGRGGALAASLLLAISPSAVYFSRSLDSAMVVAACGLALVVGLINYLDTHRPIPLYVAAVSLGLGLAAGPGSLTLLLIFATFALLQYLGERLLGRETGWSSLLEAWWALRGEKGLLTRAGVVFGATFGLAATALVLHPGGIGHAADLIGAWAQGFLPEPDGQPIIYPLLLLLRYEPLILILGLVEAGWVIVGRHGDPSWQSVTPQGTLSEQTQGETDWAAQQRSSFPHTAFLAFWVFMATLVILVSGHRPPGNILLVVVPLALLAGQGIERAWRWVTRHDLWPSAALVALLALAFLIFFYLQLATYTRLIPGATLPLAGLTLSAAWTYPLLASVALLLLVGLGIVAWVWQGPELVVAGGWLVLLISLGLYGVKAMWGLNFARASDARELMIVQATAPDVRLLVEESEALSLDQAGDAHTLPITVDATTGPVIAWYLREFDRQTVVEGLSAPPDTVAAVTLAVQDPPWGETFRGRGFPLRSHWLPWGKGVQDLVKWILFTEGDLPIVDREVVLWIASQP